MDKEISEFLDRKTQLDAMAKSVTEFREKLDKDLQDFFEAKLGLQKGKSFHILEAIKKAREIKE
jgi:hypothetical protein